jgi:hypothetical protein
VEYGLDSKSNSQDDKHQILAPGSLNRIDAIPGRVEVEPLEVSGGHWLPDKNGWKS